MYNRFPLIGDFRGFDAVILADGDFPRSAEPLRLLRDAPFVCACDGAVGHYPEADAVVGDGDSVPEALRSRLVQVDEQDDNDLTKATRYCMAQGFRRIVYLGATGRREDHTLGNISLMARYAMEMGLEPLMATDYGWFVVAQGNARFSAFAGQQVSIFNIDSARLCSVGLKWQSYPYRRLWQGTLNEALASEFSIQADGHYLLYRTYQPK
jgi:thiamine pyrophosphokinase